MTLPVPSFNVINGGKHAGNNLAFQVREASCGGGQCIERDVSRVTRAQEFMILPVGARSFQEAMQVRAGAGSVRVVCGGAVVFSPVLCVADGVRGVPQLEGRDQGEVRAGVAWAPHVQLCVRAPKRCSIGRRQCWR